MDKFSYGLGMGIGQNLASMGVSSLEFADFVQGMKDVLAGAETQLTHAEAQKVVNEYFSKLAEEAYAKTKESGEAFLEANKKREGVTTLPSGLQYEVINVGLGKNLLRQTRYSVTTRVLLSMVQYLTVLLKEVSLQYLVLIR